MNVDGGLKDREERAGKREPKEKWRRQAERQSSRADKVQEQLQKEWQRRAERQSSKAGKVQEQLQKVGMWKLLTASILEDEIATSI